MLKRIEHLVRRVLNRAIQSLSSARSTTSGSAESILSNVAAPKILLLRHDRIGDVLVSIPVFRIIKAHFPHAHISVLLGHRNAAMKSLLKRFDVHSEIYPRQIVARVNTMIRLRRTLYDVVVDMMDNTSATSSLIVTLLRKKHTIGFEKQNSNLYSQTVRLPDRTQVHMVEVMAQLLTPFGIDPTKEDLMLEYRLADSVPIESKGDSKTIFFNISGGKSSTWWGSDNYTNAIKQVMKRLPGWKVVCGASADYQTQLVDICESTRAERCPPVTSLDEYALFMYGARVLISPDTSIVHLAAALGIPSVVLYPLPAADRMPWYPYGVRYKALISSTGTVEPIRPEELVNTVTELCTEN